jgi:hypothetical protein
MAKDNDPKNKNILKSTTAFCATSKIIDRCLGYYGADLVKYRSLMKLSKQKEEFEYGFEPRSEDHPYKNNFKPKHRNTHLKTYTENYVPGAEPDGTFGLMDNSSSQILDKDQVSLLNKVVPKIGQSAK